MVYTGMTLRVCWACKYISLLPVVSGEDGRRAGNVCWDRAALARLGSLQELPSKTVQPPLIYGGGRPVESQLLEMTLS